MCHGDKSQEISGKQVPFYLSLISFMYLNRRRTNFIYPLRFKECPFQRRVTGLPRLFPQWILGFGPPRGAFRKSLIAGEHVDSRAGSWGSRKLVALLLSK
jgi:hypothetical protein